jgi:hypothetical protein
MVFGGLALLFAFWHLSETNRNRGSAETARQIMQGYVSRFRSRVYWGYTLSIGFISAVFFAFLAGASAVGRKIAQARSREPALEPACAAPWLESIRKGMEAHGTGLLSTSLLVSCRYSSEVSVQTTLRIGLSARCSAGVVEPSDSSS